MKIINLDQAVINALKFFTKNQPQHVNLKSFKFPLVAGSGNAYNTCQILFSDQPAIIGDADSFKYIAENYKPLIKRGVTKEAVIISAAGEKDSVWQVELGKKLKLRTILLTCSANSSAAQIADKVYTFRKIAEPYTYNVSTYLGMIIGQTKEDPKNILKTLKKIKFPRGFKDYKSYSFILPDKYGAITSMLEIKKSELFGPKLNLRSFSQKAARHAKYVIPWDKELVITLGGKNKYFGDKENRWDIKLPKNHDFGLMLSLTYYLIGKIQQSKPDYFKKNIENYCQDYGPRAYGKNKPFDVVVPGN